MLTLNSTFLPEAEEIAKRYDYRLPKITNQKYNDYLKLSGAGAGIRKNITSHVARHTFATYLPNRDIPIETVSKTMKHSNIKMTQRYAQLLGKKVVDEYFGCVFVKIIFKPDRYRLPCSSTGNAMLNRFPVR